MKKGILAICSMLMIVCVISVGIVPVFAHDQRLNVLYDNCVYVVDAEGIDEMWYCLDSYTLSQHLDHNVDTIKYYFSETAKQSNYSWADNTTSEIAQAVKTAVVNSMKKWDDVYFYSQDSSGNITKNKVINIIEGTASDHNLTIYPISGETSVATFNSVNSTLIESGDVQHKHFIQCEMTIYVENFVKNIIDSNPEDYYCEWGPAHEIGHILGLVDIDVFDHCHSNSFDDNGNDINHHQELMMGYHRETVASKNITYKDIAGVAIARGFHTDNDHKWLNAGKQDERGFKFICSICNGVKYVALPSGYTYDTYGRCNNIHSLAGGNMMAVASYGTKDYYKCKYCRYVAPFELLVEQNYCLTTEDSSGHMCLNNVQGLWYTFYETHSFTRNYVAINKFTHWCYCACGERISKPHVLSMLNGQISDFCIICGELIVGSGTLNSIPINYPHTNNGSYILPNGIIVLVPEDEEAYFAGTLVFHNGEIM